VIELQRAIASKVRTEDDFGKLEFVCGLDVSSNFFDRKGPIHAAAVLLDMKTLEVLEEIAVSAIPEVPYRTGFLGFREAPAMIEALNKLSKKPDLLLVDGHGIAHPRKCGIASHVGVLLDLPSIGVAKSRLIGEIKRNNLIHRGECVAKVWQSKKGARPIFISPGHRISLESAVSLVKKLIRGRRLPEPIRLAHERSNRQRFLYLLGSEACPSS
jgi:deoxyribonuclease V